MDGQTAVVIYASSERAPFDGNQVSSRRSRQPSEADVGRILALRCRPAFLSTTAARDEDLQRGREPDVPRAEAPQITPSIFTMLQARTNRRRLGMGGIRAG